MTGVRSEPRGLLAAVRRLTTGVTVLTATHDGRVHGATVSSANLVARDPLMVCAGLRRGSALCELAVASGQFAVNVLADRQAIVADWFANPERPPGADQFALVDWEPAAGTGLPVLRNTVAVLICQLLHQIPAGDHDLLLAEVSDGRVGVGRPLVNFDGGLYGADFRGVDRRRGWRSTAATTFE